MKATSWLAALAAVACAGSNGAPDVQRAATPALAPPGGTYAAAQSVTISSATTGAAIHCTQDGSVPTGASPVCASPIAVAATATLRAIATATGYADSEVASATYTIQPLPRAPKPVFSPPGGTYAAAQSVTISSATAGAVIHCTQDGSVPTAASPVCASPIAVAATTTLRAIATATGYADSEVASATYAIGQGPSLVEALQALSDRRQLLAHQSVGGNVVYGGDWDGSNGVDRLCRDNPDGGVTVIAEPSGLAQVPLGGWAEAAVGVNGDPLGKLTDFDHMVRTRFAGGLDFAAFKFCYADFTARTDVAAIFARYKEVMDALEADFPGRIVYWTVPLQVENSGNPNRNAFSDLVRTRYGPTGRVFDLAALESHDSDGNLVLSYGVPALAPEWAAADGSHLNDAFSDLVARAYVELMYRIEVGAVP